MSIDHKRSSHPEWTVERVSAVRTGPHSYSRNHGNARIRHRVPRRSTQVVGPLGTPQAFRGDMWLTRLAYSKPGQWKNKTRAGQRGSVLESADSLTHCAPKTKLRSIQR
jgi:hypothetical protein